MASNRSLLDEAGARLTLVSLGDAALYVAAEDGTRSRVPIVGKQLALIAYLACANARGVSRARLIDLLWGDRDFESADNAFRRTLTEIRKKIGDGVFGPGGSSPVTLGTPIDTDRDRLADALQRGDLESAVRLYTGDFLIGLSVAGGKGFDDWVGAERHRLRQSFCRSAVDLARARLASGRHDQAIDLAQRARAADDSDESNWAVVLECLLQARKVTRANIEADALERHFETLGRRPKQLTRQVITRVRKAVDPEPQAGDAPGLRPELVGRTLELSAVVEEWRLLLNGREGFRHLQIVGDAGLGKTRLLRGLTEQLAGKRAIVVQVSARYGTRDVAYAFAADIVAELVVLPGGAGVSPTTAGTLVSICPTAFEHYRAAVPDVSFGEEALRRRVDALAELIKNLTAEGPIALLLDDLHWSDPPSLRLLRAAFAKLHRVSALVVSASRHPTDDLCAATNARRYTLRPLDVEAVHELVTSLGTLPGEPWADLLPRLLHAATGGSPLLVIETLQLLLEEGTLGCGTDGWRANDWSAIEAALGLGSAVHRRVLSLDSEERSVLLSLAIAGVALNTNHLALATARSVDAVGQTLATLEQRGVIVRRASDWAPAHDEHAAAVLRSAREEEQSRVARAVGRAIVDVGADAQSTQVAARLLAKGGEPALLQMIFARTVRAARLAGETRPDRALARDLLGPTTNVVLEADLVRSLPWLVRARIVSRRRLVSVVMLALTCVAALAAAAVRYSRPPVIPDAVLFLVTRIREDSSRHLFEVPINEAEWKTAEDIEVDVSGRPDARTWTAATTPRPAGDGWISWRPMSPTDSGVLDVFDVRLDGRERRLTFAAGDDLTPTWAPDMSRFAFATARWNELAQWDLAIADSVGGHVRQLTSGDDADSWPMWSPDGSRIAFVRDRWEGGRRLCVIDSDGSGLQCFSSRFGELSEILGWVDSRRLFIRDTRDSVSRAVLMDVDSRREQPVGAETVGPRDDRLSPDGKWAVCTCARGRDGRAIWTVYRLDRPDEHRTLRVLGAQNEDVTFAWAPASRRAPFLATLRIEGGPGAPVIGAEYEMRVVGADSSGRPVVPGAVRWHSVDTTIATVDSLGRVRPHREGRVAIRATAGGWREARQEFDVRAPEHTLVLDEQWARGLDTTWIPFGDPTPQIVFGDGGVRALHNNGDKYYFSGAYTADAFDVTRGLWIEATLSIPLRGLRRWQDQLLTVFSVADTRVFKAWDHRTGDGPPGVGTRCTIQFPVSAGGASRDSMHVSGYGNIPPKLAAPVGIATGRPFRALIQIFPDGRCGFAIDDELLIVGTAGFFASHARVKLEGRSVGTTILVYRVRVMTGIAPHVRWNAESRASRAR
jgi:DNA-binding SARP family transcriptional activator